LRNVFRGRAGNVLSRAKNKRGNHQSLHATGKSVAHESISQDRMAKLFRAAQGRAKVIF
jgi:hypothetical protein